MTPSARCGHGAAEVPVACLTIPPSSAFIVLNAVIGMVTYVTLLERKFAARMQSRIGPYCVGPARPAAAHRRRAQADDEGGHRPATAPTAGLQPGADRLPGPVHADLRHHSRSRPAWAWPTSTSACCSSWPCRRMEIVGPVHGRLGLEQQVRAALGHARGEPDHLLRPALHLRRAGPGGAGRARCSCPTSRRRRQGLLVRLLPGHRPAGLRRLHRGHAGRREPRALRHPGGGVGAGGGLPRRVLRDEVRADPARRVRAHDRHVVPGRAPLPRRLARARGRRWLGPLWFLLKAMFIFLLVTWVRWSFVRIRVDQILAISWKLLLPATLLLLLATALRGRVRGAAGGA